MREFLIIFDPSQAIGSSLTPLGIKMRKIAAMLFGMICLGAGAFFFATKEPDRYHTAERRSWKDAAILAITNDLKDPHHLKKRFGEIPRPLGHFDTSEPEWLTTDTIVCRDASWLAYRGQCHKEDPQIHDIFIARASDGNWYYSDYHFCKEMCVLAMHGQPESLQQFKARYFLARFDGASDEALNPTRASGTD